MRQIEIAPVPNQSFSVRLDDQQYDFVIKFEAGVMSVTITRDNVLLVSNLRAVPGEPLLPYRYLESGNFVITTKDGDYPNYLEFGVTQNLIFASHAELEALRAR